MIDLSPHIFFSNSKRQRDDQFAEHFFKAVLPPSSDNLRFFFDSIAAASREAFGAKMAAIWDNNSYSKCLVLQTTSPKRRLTHNSYTIPSELSLTGLAIQRCDIVIKKDLTKPVGKRRFAIPELIHELGLTYMVCIPVSTPFDQALTSFVLDLYYDCDQTPVSPVSRLALDGLINAIGLALDYILYQLDGDIRHMVSEVAHTASGISSLLDSVFLELEKLTLTKEASIYHWVKQEKRLELERSAGPKAKPKKIPLKIQVLDDPQSDLSSEIIKTCVGKRRPFVRGEIAKPSSEKYFGESLPQGGEETHSTTFEKNHGKNASSNFRCHFLAIPILSTDGAVIGVLTCSDPVTKESIPVSFSSLDMHILSIFADCIAPCMERFLRLREGSILIKVIKDVSLAVVSEYLLEDVLQKTVQTVVSSLNAEVGSIYLLEEETNDLVMRAGAGSDRCLISKARYKVGEGLTGEIARGKTLNFKSWEELNSYPTWKGKYDDEIWLTKESAKCNTFLGLPILGEDRILGVWKVANLRPSDDHPDDYFTDEDIEAGKVLSSFLAYVIQNSRYKQQASQRFNFLAQNSIDIARAKDEDEAIYTVMTAIEEAGFPNALLSLYNSQTGQIKGMISSGRGWSSIVDMTTAHINDNDLIAEVLRTNVARFVPNSSEEPLCEQEVVSIAGIRAQYVIPLRLEEEMIGVLQVDMGDKQSMQEREALILRAFADHLAIAISRIRNIQKSLELTDQVMSSSRFIVAETLSSMAVHSTGHKIDEILAQLTKDLKRQDVRQNRLVLETFESWHEKLVTVEEDLRRALQIVKAGEEQVSVLTDVHAEIQKTINMWISFIKGAKAHIQPQLEATENFCDLSANALREILSVLIVNSVQAHAKKITIRTYNDHNIQTPPVYLIEDAICVEFSDDGDGLATRDPEEIFKPTYTTKHKTFGTGLGLFIAQRLARKGGGNLEVLVRAVKHKGTSFLLILPSYKKGT